MSIFGCVTDTVKLVYIVMLQIGRKTSVLTRLHPYMSIFSFATLITVQNGLHPSICTILHLKREYVAPLVISPVHIMQATDSTTHCNHKVPHRMFILI
jgi:hypothetical protein